MDFEAPGTFVSDFEALAKLLAPPQDQRDERQVGRTLAPRPGRRAPPGAPHNSPQPTRTTLDRSASGTQARQGRTPAALGPASDWTSPSRPRAVSAAPAHAAIRMRDRGAQGLHGSRRVHGQDTGDRKTSLPAATAHVRGLPTAGSRVEAAAQQAGGRPAAVVDAADAAADAAIERDDGREVPRWGAACAPASSQAASLQAFAGGVQPPAFSIAAAA